MHLEEVFTIPEGIGGKGFVPSAATEGPCFSVHIGKKVGYQPRLMIIVFLDSWA